MQERPENRYESRGLDNKLRSSLSEILYAWEGLYPEPMTSFKRVALTLSEKQVDDLVSLIHIGLTDSRNVKNVTVALQNAVDDFQKNQFNYDKVRSELDTASSQVENVIYIGNALTLRQAINRGFREGINFDKLNDEAIRYQAALVKAKTNTPHKVNSIEEILNAIQTLSTYTKENPALYQVLKESAQFYTTLSKSGGIESAAVAAMFGKKLDEIIRDGSLYNHPPAETAKLLKEKFDDAKKDIPTLRKLQLRINQAVEELKQNKPNANTQEFTKFNTKYLSKPLDNIIADLEAKRKTLLPEIVAEEKAKMISDKLASLAKGDGILLQELINHLKHLPEDNKDLPNWKARVVPEELRELVNNIVEFKELLPKPEVTHSTYGLPPFIDNVNDRLDAIKYINNSILLDKFLSNSIPNWFVLQTSKLEAIGNLVWWDGFLSADDARMQSAKNYGKNKELHFYTLDAVTQNERIFHEKLQIYNRLGDEYESKIKLLEDFKFISQVTQLARNHQNGTLAIPKTIEEIRAFSDLRNHFRHDYAPNGKPISPLFEDINNELNKINRAIQPPKQTPVVDANLQQQQQKVSPTSPKNSTTAFLTKGLGGTVKGLKDLKGTLRKNLTLPRSSSRPADDLPNIELSTAARDKKKVELPKAEKKEPELTAYSRGPGRKR